MSSINPAKKRVTWAEGEELAQVRTFLAPDQSVEEKLSARFLRKYQVRSFIQLAGHPERFQNLFKQCVKKAVKYTEKIRQDGGDSSSIRQHVEAILGYARGVAEDTNLRAENYERLRKIGIF